MNLGPIIFIVLAILIYATAAICGIVSGVYEEMTGKDLGWHILGVGLCLDASLVAAASYTLT